MKSIRALIGRIMPLLKFRDSKSYWETRYRIGGHSGEGSRGENARYKADVINRLISENGIESMIEFGCGDGHQLGMFRVAQYLGIDVSETIVSHCRAVYASDATKKFLTLDEYRGEGADLAVSLDVIFHLIEDAVYNAYLERLFAAARRFVVIYSTSADMKSTGTPHVRHRDVAGDVQARFPGFTRLLDVESRMPAPVRFDRGLPTRFFVYARR